MFLQQILWTYRNDMICMYVYCYRHSKSIDSMKAVKASRCLEVSSCLPAGHWPSSGMWCCTIGWTAPEVSKAVQSFELSETNCPLTKCHISEHFNFWSLLYLHISTPATHTYVAVLMPTCSYLTDLVTVHYPVLHVSFLSVQLFQLWLMYSICCFLGNTWLQLVMSTWSYTANGSSDCPYVWCT